MPSRLSYCSRDQFHNFVTSRFRRAITRKPEKNSPDAVTEMRRGRGNLLCEPTFAGGDDCFLFVSNHEWNDYDDFGNDGKSRTSSGTLHPGIADVTPLSKLHVNRHLSAAGPPVHSNNTNDHRVAWWMESKLQASKAETGLSSSPFFDHCPPNYSDQRACLSTFAGFSYAIPEPVLMPAGLESSGSSSGPGSPLEDHHIHPMSSASASPPSTSSDSTGSLSPCRRQSLGELDSPKGNQTYREKRKRNNDAARKSREKRRLNDVAMEAKLLELTKENDLLKSRLNTLQVTDLKPDTTSSGAPGSVIMLGPPASAPSVSMPSSFFGSHLPSFPTFGGLPNPDFGYQNFDFNFAAAAAAAGFKMPPGSGMPMPGSSIFSNHLLAAAAAALPSFMHQPPPPPSFPSDPVPSGFMSSSRSAFHRPSVVEMTPQVPAPPRPTMTENLCQSRPTSVIMGAQRPSVVQASGSSSTTTSSNGCTLLDLSQSSTPRISNAPGGRFQFVNSLPLASESRGPVFPGMEPRTLPPLAQLDMPGVSGPSFHGSGVIKHNSKPAQPTNTQGSSLLGTLLTANRPVSPKVPQSRTEQQSGLATMKSEMKTEPDLPLAVQLDCSAASSSSSDSSNGNKSDTDSIGSPESVRSCSEELQLPDEKPASTDKKKGPDLERYRDRRRRNNEAAKRCRANRRAAYEFRSKRSQYLETENEKLRAEAIQLNKELERLKGVIAIQGACLLPATS
uniref:BZIP domain-containing protein n=1 Tax=Panagrellus redivivus TaxID=6233 RepID=A0A7E4VNU2_PANRE